MSAFLVHWQKARISQHYVMELKIYQVEFSIQYPNGIKYRLICKDLNSNRRVLMDNHHPKGHHLHLDDHEMTYEYKNSVQLVDDFNHFVLKHLGVRL